MKTIHYAILMAALSTILSCHKDATPHQTAGAGEPPSGITNLVRIQVDTLIDAYDTIVEKWEYGYDAQGRRATYAHHRTQIQVGYPGAVDKDSAFASYTYTDTSMTSVSASGTVTHRLNATGQIIVPWITYDADGYTSSDTSFDINNMYTNYWHVSGGNYVRHEEYYNHQLQYLDTYTYLSQVDNRDFGNRWTGRRSLNLLDNETHTGAGMTSTFKHLYTFDAQGRVIYEKWSPIYSSRFIYW